MMKRMMSLLLCVMMMALLCVSAYAAGPAEQNQIEHEGGTINPTGGAANIVSFRKEIEPITVDGNKVENEFMVNLEVVTTQDVSQVKVDKDAAVVLVVDSSGSMSKKSGAQTKMAAAKNAMTSFIKDFGEVEPGEDGILPKRMIAIVDYDDNARLVRTDLNNDNSYDNEPIWIDVAYEEWESATYAHAVIERIEANGETGEDDRNTKYIWVNGSTNIEAGLLLAYNLFKSDQENYRGDDVKEAQAIQNKTVILLTDGVATRTMTSLPENPTETLSSDNVTTNVNQTIADNLNKVSTTKGYSDTLYNDWKPDNSKYYYAVAPYYGTVYAQEVGRAIQDEGINLYGVPIGLTTIYVAKDAAATSYGNATGIASEYAQQQSDTTEGETYQQYYEQKLDELVAADYNASAPTEWMGDWCTAAYSVENADELAAMFDSLLTLIETSAQAWTVMDPLPSNFVAVLNNELPNGVQWVPSDKEYGTTLSWNLREAAAVTSGGKRTYSYSYPIRMVNTVQPVGAENSSQIVTDNYLDTNNDTTLKYTILKNGSAQYVGELTFEAQEDTLSKPNTVPANAVPAVDAYVASFEFVKQDELSQVPLNGVGFTLSTKAYNDSNADPQDYSFTAVSDEQGKVKFNNLPAGTYTLTETTVPTGYMNAESYQFKVAWGQFTDMDGNVIEDFSDVLKNHFANKRIPGTLTIQEQRGNCVVQKPIDIDGDYDGLDQKAEFKFEITLNTRSHYGSDAGYNLKITGEYFYKLNGATKNEENEEYKLSFNDGVAEVILGLGDKLEILDLPVGTMFTVKQKEPESSTSQNYDLTALSVDDSKHEEEELDKKTTTGFILLNEDGNDYLNPKTTFINTRRTGSLKVSKTTIGTSHKPNEAFGFEFIVHGGSAYPNAQVKDGIYGTFYDEGGIGAKTIRLTAKTLENETKASVANFELDAADFVVFDGLPVDFTYELKEVMTEEQADDYLSNQPENGYTGTIEADEENQSEVPIVHEFTNIRRTGSLIVRKQVEGDGAAKDKKFTFEITLDDRTIHTDSSVEGIPINGEDIKVTLYEGAENPDGTTEDEGREIDVLFNQGVARVELTHNQYVVIDHLPTKMDIEVRELSDQELRNVPADPDEAAALKKEAEDKQDPNYGKLGYADYEVWVETISQGTSSKEQSAVASGAIYEDGDDVEPLAALYTNIRRVGNLTIRKKVAEAGDRQALFDFELTVTSDRIRPDQINGMYGDLWFNDGVAKFQLGDGQRVTAIGLPAGAQYSIVEDAKGHIQAGDSLTGVITENGHVTVNITNWLPFLPVTGDDSRLGLMLSLLAISATGLAVIAVRRRRSRGNG